MKHLTFLIILLSLAGTLNAQSPQKFNYQGVARFSNGAVISNQDITIRASILNGSPFGLSQYVEKHSVTTNILGLFTTSIGGGQVLTGNFTNITWGNSDKYLKIELDPSGGEDYSLSGVFQLLSVPYSLYSTNTERLQGNLVSPIQPNDGQVLVWNSNSGMWLPADAAQSLTYTAGPGISINLNNQISNTAPDQEVVISGYGATTVFGTYPNFIINTPVPTDNSPTNEIQTLSLLGNVLSLSSGGGSITLPAEVDGSITNEIQTLSLSGNTLSLSNNGGEVNLPTGTSYSAGSGININGNIISNSGDLSNSNEIQTLSLIGSTLSLTNGGGSITLPVEIDGSVTNEIQTLSLSGNTLSLSNNGGAVNLPTGTTYSAGNGINISGNIISNSGDLSNSNEIQTLSLTGGTLSLSSGGGSVNLPTAPTYTAGAGITIDGNNQIINIGDTNAANDITITTVGSGDVNGNFPNLIVDGLQGKAVSPIAPTVGQVLKWNGTSWAPSTASSSSVYNIGDLAFGGMIFWLDETETHGLVVSTQNLSFDPLYLFSNARGDGIYAGLRNTNFLLQSAGWAQNTNPIVLCALYQGGDFGDWYLPSKYELNLIYLNLHQSGLGGFANYLYWSSTEGNDGAAWYQNFSNGSQGYSFNNPIAHTRAVRRF